MTDTATTANKSSRTASVRASFDTARVALGNRGNLLTLILSSLFVLVIAFAVYFMTELVSFAIETFTPLPEWGCNAVFYGALMLGALLAVLPVALGWLRLAAQMANGETPFARDVLWYMGAPRRYRRSVLLSALCALAVGLPVALVGGLYVGASLFANEIQAGTLAADIATRQLSVLYTVTSLLALPVLSLEGFALPVLAEAAKDEKRTPFAAVLAGVCKGARHFGKSWRFLVDVLLRFALSLCTLGILWLIYFNPVCATAYAAFAEELK